MQPRFRRLGIADEWTFINTMDATGNASPTLKVLLVEDDEVSQIVTQRLLERLGHTVAVASDGLEATQMASRKIYDLILMDLNMPTMDGIEASKRILSESKKKSQSPIIMALTAYKLQEFRDKCEEAGMSDFMAKPIQVDVLKKKILRWFTS